jgi:hypothetical protein
MVFKIDKEETLFHTAEINRVYKELNENSLSEQASQRSTLRSKTVTTTLAQIPREIREQKSTATLLPPQLIGAEKLKKFKEKDGRVKFGEEGIDIFSSAEVMRLSYKFLQAIPADELVVPNLKECVGLDEGDLLLDNAKMTFIAYLREKEVISEIIPLHQFHGRNEVCLASLFILFFFMGFFVFFYFVSLVCCFFVVFVVFCGF